MSPAAPPPTLTVSVPRELSLPGAQLRVLVPGEVERALALDLHPRVVGTDEDCDIIISGAGVSRRHCEVTLTPQGVRLLDLGSKNGTRIGTVRILEGYLGPGEVAQLGHAQLKVMLRKEPLTVPLSPEARFGLALGVSAPMRALFAVLERAATMDDAVLLLGASGTGKELLARGLHDLGPRASGPFGVVDCSALPPGLIEAELFGHAKGAFSGATVPRRGLFPEAHGGTLFLDEVGELPLELQPKLLRALESKEVRPVGGNRYERVDVRIVAATNRDLRSLVAAGRFREDLFYRLAVIEARVPSLRERREDIPLLVEHFLGQRTPPALLSDLPPHTLELFASHGWPGNVRELRNAVSRTLVFPRDQAFNHALGEAAFGPPGGEGSASLTRLPLREAREHVVAEFERVYVEAQLRRHGTPTLAAKAMGVSRQLVHRLMQQYGLSTRE